MLRNKNSRIHREQWHGPAYNTRSTRSIFFPFIKLLVHKIQRCMYYAQKLWAACVCVFFLLLLLCFSFRLWFMLCRSRVYAICKWIKHFFFGGISILTFRKIRIYYILTRSRLCISLCVHHVQNVQFRQCLWYFFCTAHSDSFECFVISLFLFFCHNYFACCTISIANGHIKDSSNEKQSNEKKKLWIARK